MSTLRFVDLFCGIGGFHLGAERACSAAGISSECVLASDIDPTARAVYAERFPSAPLLGDINLIEPASAPAFDLLFAGFPCQSFSIAGEGMGFEDETRGTLFFNIAQWIGARRPQAFLLENVKGLVIHDDSQTIRTILRVLRSDLGYDVHYAVLDSWNYGVAQCRERIYIAGFRDGAGLFSDGPPFEFPPPRGGRRVVMGDIRDPSPDHRNYMSETYWQWALAHRRRHEEKGHGFGYVVRGWDEPAGTIVCGGMGTERNLLRDVPIREFPCEADPNRVPNSEGIRVMTALEFERLQGFPDGWTAVGDIPETKRRKTLANAVTVNVVEDVVGRMLPCLNL